MRLGLVCIIRRESCKFFPAHSVSRLRISPAWQAQAWKQGVSTRRAFKSSTVESSAATTLTMSGSPGMQAYASAKVPPGATLLSTLLLPQTSLISMMTLPERTTPSCSVGAPSIRMISPFLQARAFAFRQLSSASISSGVMPRKSGAFVK